jgi:predicted ATPase
MTSSLASKFITQLEYRAIRKMGLTKDSFHTRSLTPKSINIFAGPNGAGKSTILDAIGIAGHPGKIASLRRNHAPNGLLSRIRLVFRNKSQLSLDLRYNTQVEQNADYTSSYAVLGVYTEGNPEQWPGPRKVGQDVAHGADLQLFAERLADSDVQVREIGAAGAAHVSATDIASELNLLRSELTGLNAAIATPVSQGPDGFRLVFADDPLTLNTVQPEHMPSGWMHLARLLAQLRQAPEGSICLIEEPETHLHASLQRILARSMGEIATRRTLQLFMSTHSSVLLNDKLWPADTAFFSVDGERAHETGLGNAMLDLLGVKGSDLLQSNGVIWVEGPSDRLYFNALLAELQLQQFGEIRYRENVHYSFSLFGGACISHFGADASAAAADVEGLVNVVRINRNAAIAIDRDADFGIDGFGDLYPLNGSGRTKQRLLAGIHQDGNGRNAAYMGDKYTIECYLPAALARKYLDPATGYVKVRSGVTKVWLARHAVDTGGLLGSMLAQHADLRQGMRRLLGAIASWN